MASGTSTNRTRILLSFACIYLVWGSTYLAMRVGVEKLPPFVLGSTRFLISGPLLLLLSAIFRLKMWPARKEMGRIALIGVLMLGCGNMSVIWAEQYIPSGLAALLVASIPLYAALIEICMPKGEGLPRRGWAGIAIGLAGIVLLLWPQLRSGLHGDSRQIIASAVALLGALSWTVASILSRRSTIGISGFASAGWQMLFGGIFDTILMLANGGYHGSQWGLQAWGSVLYLVIFGSLLTYTAYIYLLDHVAVSKVATYAYVNPMIAVVLGVIFLGEHFVGIEYIGMGAILLAVFLVTSSKTKTGKPNTVDEDLACIQE